MMFVIFLWIFFLVVGALILYWIITSAINYSVIGAIHEERRHSAKIQADQHKEIMAQMHEMRLLMREQNELLKTIASRSDA